MFLAPLDLDLTHNTPPTPHQLLNTTHNYRLSIRYH